MMGMDNSAATQLAKYVPYKTRKSSSNRRYRRILKAILPRKRTSKLRISHNISWNRNEDSTFIRAIHFSKLDFCNEINDNSLNELREALLLSQLQNNSPYKSHANRNYCTNVGTAPTIPSTLDDLTPPATPFGTPVSFLFDSNIVISSSMIQSEALPLTPATPGCESDVFTFQDSTAPQSVSSPDPRALFLQSLLF